MKATKGAFFTLLISSLHQQGVHARNFRFKKFDDPGTVGLESVIDDVDFPLDKTEKDTLRKLSKSVSVYDEEEVCRNVDLQICRDDLTVKGLYPVTHPDSTDRSDLKKFWADFEETVTVQKHLKDYKKNPCMVDPLPEVMPQMTQYWRGLNILEVAEAVRDEFPGLYHYRMLADWVANKEVNYDDVIVPKTGQIDFIRREVMLSDMVGFAVRAVGPCNFSLKWSEGRARPEELAFAISKKEINVPTSSKSTKPSKSTKNRRGGVDIFDDISGIIEEMDLRKATDFTAYDEGSPRHPSWPAMHSASSASSFWLSVILDLSPQQLCDARMLDWSVAYARTVAGVHYPSDNIAGLMVGQGILAQILPDYLHDEYGADKKKVEDKIKEIVFDWTTFEDTECFNKKRYKSVPAARPAVCFDPPIRRPENPNPHPPTMRDGRIGVTVEGDIVTEE